MQSPILELRLYWNIYAQIGREVTGTNIYCAPGWVGNFHEFFT